jgi:hypothetical protein
VKGVRSHTFTVSHPHHGAGAPPAVWYATRSPPLSWSLRARDRILMTQQLDWAGLPIKPGGSYGGRVENIPAILGQKPVLAAAKKHQHYAVISEENVAEIFGHGSYKLTRAEAAKMLEALTGAHRTSCYRALRLKGRFGLHLQSDGAMLSWR